MTLETNVAAHYTSGTLLERIRDGLAAMGVDPDRPAPEDLKPIDEFHVGGLQATEDLIAQIALGPDMHVIDIGSRSRRHLAVRRGAHRCARQRHRPDTGVCRCRSRPFGHNGVG